MLALAAGSPRAEEPTYFLRKAGGFSLDQLMEKLLEAGASK